MLGQRLWIVTTVFILLIAAIAVSFYALRPTGENLQFTTKTEDRAGITGSPPDVVLPSEPGLRPMAARSLKFLFFGDLMIDRHVGEKLAGKNIGFLLDRLAGDDKQFFSGFDLVGANLEGAVTNSGAHYAPQNAYDFAFSPERIKELKDYGFNYFTLANNHFSDQGARGVEETRKNLTALGLYYSGAPDAQIDEYTAQVVSLADQQVALLGLSMVYAHFDLSAAKDLVSSMASTTDLVVVNIHWGTEYEHQFNKYQQNIGHALIDAGADIIIGHHPHVVQGMEVYQGKPIFYSLGNFIFDQYFSADTQEGLALALDVSQATTTILLTPLISEKSVPRIMEQEEREIFFEKFVAWSRLDEDKESLVISGQLELPR